MQIKVEKEALNQIANSKVRRTDRDQSLKISLDY